MGEILVCRHCGSRHSYRIEGMAEVDVQIDVVDPGRIAHSRVGRVTGIQVRRARCARCAGEILGCAGMRVAVVDDRVVWLAPP